MSEDNDNETICPGITDWDFTDMEMPSSPAVHEISYLSDRPAALVGAAFLEVRLTQFLKQNLVQDATVQHDLFRISGPLGFFVPKIQIAYLIGMFTPDGFRDLDLIAKIRNDFAHVLMARTFNDGKIKSRCMELKTIESFIAQPTRGVALDRSEIKLVRNNPRCRFLFAINSFSWAMRNRPKPYF